jgi:hypothetical protein
MNGSFDFGILILGLGAVAFVVGLGAWIRECIKKLTGPEPAQNTVEYCASDPSAKTWENTLAPEIQAAPSESLQPPRLPTPPVTTLPSPLAQPAPQPPLQKAPLPDSTIKQPIIPKKESIGYDVATVPLHSPHITEKPETPPALSLQIQKTPLISSSPPSKLKTDEHAPELLRSSPSVSNHKKEHKRIVSVTTPEIPRPVKKQAPLPEYGGMCSKCGENPKVPGNDGFCKDCSPLD